MYVKEQILTLQAYKPGKPSELVMKEHGLTQVVKLASNENPFGCSPEVMAELQNLGKSIAIYPDGSSEKLSEEVAKFLGVEKEQLLFGSGADEVIQMISRGLLKCDHNIVQATPTFSQYSHHAIIEGAEVREVPLKKGVHDLEEMLKAIDDKTKIVWICNPNNPTGTYVDQVALESFLSRVPKRTFIVIDEAYFEYATAKDYPNSLNYLSNYENVIVLRTFSKAYGLASLRIGYGVGNKQLIKELNIARLPFNTSHFAQKAACVALRDQQFIEMCIERNREGLRQYVDFCEENHISYYPSEANFIYMNVHNSQYIFSELEKKGYIIRAFKEGIRITIGSNKENEGLLLELRELIRKGVVERSI